MKFLSRPFGQFVLAAVIFCGLFGTVFSKSFDPDMIMFSNDGPLGANMAEQARLPQIFTGAWADLNWLGGHAGSALPDLTYGLLYIVGPLWYAKIYAPFALALLGLSAWFFFHRLRFHPVVCVLGALAVALNMNVFSNSCWGLASRATMLASVFFALAMFPQPGSRWQLPKLILSGFGVGMGIMEGYDIGAIYSLYVAAYAAFVTFIAPGPLGKRIALAVGKTAVVAISAAIIASAGLVTLIGTQVQGFGGKTGNPAPNEQGGWDWATQWSLPKTETLRVVIPGLFGYRMDGQDGSGYWGTVGQQPGWEKHHQGFPRHSGSGEYAGVLVVLVAAWGLCQTFRKTGRIVASPEKQIIWFWTGAAFISLLFAFGRHAPFYNLVYALPYFHTIRNPIKFMHPFQLALGILFAYGLQRLWTLYVTAPATRTSDVMEQVRSWWKTGPAADRKWVIGCGAAIAASVFGWLLFSSAKNEITRFLNSTGFNADQAAQILRFANGEIGFFIVFLAICTLIVAAILCGVLAGKRRNLAVGLLAVVLLVDLLRADSVWIYHFNYKDKYASNLVFDTLRDKPYEHRVTAAGFLIPKQLEFFVSVCGEWLQHPFQYYNIQSMEVIQMPRGIPADMAAFEDMFRMPTAETYQTNPGEVPKRLQAQSRRWELTNTRFILGASSYFDVINKEIDPVKKRVKIHTPFELYQETPGGAILVRTNPAGPFALFEFTGALPRAKLYSNWIIGTNDDSTLKTIAAPEFDPQTNVVVAASSGLTPPKSPDKSPGTVEITKYSPKHIELTVKVATTAVMLLNDKYDPFWKATIDGKSAPVLRCNYIMQGIALEPGDHKIVLSFEPPNTGLYISLAALAAGAVLLVLLGIVDRPTVEPTHASAPAGKK